MSTLAVNQITTQTGDTISVATGKTIHAPGAVLQVVEGLSTTDEAITSTSAFVNTTISAVITPKFNNSLIKVECLFHYHIKTGVNGGRMMLARDQSGTITDISSSSQELRCEKYGTYSGQQYWYFPFTLFATDTPATTSATTYRLRVNTTDSAGIEIFNNRGKGRMLLTEIAQ